MITDVQEQFTRVSNDSYVVHFLNIADTYDKALQIARKVGGKKYHGGGVVFQSCSIIETAKHLNNVIKQGA